MRTAGIQASFSALQIGLDPDVEGFGQGRFRGGSGWGVLGTIHRFGVEAGNLRALSEHLKPDVGAVGGRRLCVTGIILKVGKAVAKGVSVGPGQQFNRCLEATRRTR